MKLVLALHYKISKDPKMLNMCVVSQAEVECVCVTKGIKYVIKIKYSTMC